MIPLWIDRRAAELIAKLSAAQAENAVLREQLATERARFDWLAQHVNEIKLERAQLYQRIGVYLPVATIERTVVPPTPTAADLYVPPSGEKAADLGDLLAAARNLKDETERTRLRQAAGIIPDTDPNTLFEDIGDAAAEAIGATHTATGELAFVPRGT